MTERSRRNHSPASRAEVVIEADTGEVRLAELALRLDAARIRSTSRGLSS